MPTLQIDERFPVTPVRALVNAGTKRFMALQAEVLARFQAGEVAKEAAQLEIEHFWAGALRRAVVDGDVENGSLMAGQSVGMVDREAPAAEIIAELPEGSVDVRLAGRELDFVVEMAPPSAIPTPPPPPTPPAAEEDDGDLARITLRIPEAVKARAEEKAAAAGQSLNTWMVAVVRNATNDHAINVDIDLSSVPFVGYDPFAANRKQGASNRRMTGWL